MFDSLIQAIVIVGILLFVTGGILFISRPDNDKHPVDNDLNKCTTSETCKCC